MPHVTDGHMAAMHMRAQRGAGRCMQPLAAAPGRGNHPTSHKCKAIITNVQYIHDQIQHSQVSELDIMDLPLHDWLIHLEVKGAGVCVCVCVRGGGSAGAAQGAKGPWCGLGSISLRWHGILCYGGNAWHTSRVSVYKGQAPHASTLSPPPHTLLRRECMAHVTHLSLQRPSP